MTRKAKIDPKFQISLTLVQDQTPVLFFVVLCARARVLIGETRACRRGFLHADGCVDWGRRERRRRHVLEPWRLPRTKKGEGPEGRVATSADFTIIEYSCSWASSLWAASTFWPGRPEFQNQSMADRRHPRSGKLIPHQSSHNCHSHIACGVGYTLILGTPRISLDFSPISYAWYDKLKCILMNTWIGWWVTTTLFFSLLARARRRFKSALHLTVRNQNPEEEVRCYF